MLTEQAILILLNARICGAVPRAQEVSHKQDACMQVTEQDESPKITRFPKLNIPNQQDDAQALLGI